MFVQPTAAHPAAASAEAVPAVQGIRKNGMLKQFLYWQCNLADNRPFTGKQWHQQKSAFRPRAGQTSYEKRAEERKALATVKAKEKEMKDEKESERQVFCTLRKLEISI
jgi:rRNA-processing protein CGR1